MADGQAMSAGENMTVAHAKSLDYCCKYWAHTLTGKMFYSACRRVCVEIVGRQTELLDGLVAGHCFHPGQNVEV